MNRNELREELLAVLAASRELTGEEDGVLVESVLSKLEAEHVHRQWLAGWREIYEQLVPLKISTVLVVAAAQGVVIFALGEYLLRRVLDFYYYTDGYGQAWVVFGVMWLAVVLVTIATLSILVPQQKPAHRSRTVRRRLNS